MKEHKLIFTSSQLRELAKHVYLGSFFTSMEEYENEKLLMEIMNKICEVGFLEAPETGGFRPSVSDDEPPFYISQELDQECTPLIENFKKFYIDNFIITGLLSRDVMERYGKPYTPKLWLDKKIADEVEVLYKKYTDEYDSNGLANLRFVEPMTDEQDEGS